MIGLIALAGCVSRDPVPAEVIDLAKTARDASKALRWFIGGSSDAFHAPNLYSLQQVRSSTSHSARARQYRWQFQELNQLEANLTAL
jgi:hypothetical protein